MKILYFCPEYNSSKHGGRTHAREFMRALRNNPAVTKAKVWPDADTSIEATATNDLSVKRPSMLAQIKPFLRCFMPRYQLTKELCEEIQMDQYDSVVIRTAGHRNIVLKEIKRKFPYLTVLLEINALRFQEEYANIWFRRFWQNLEARRFRSTDKILAVSTNLKDYLVARGIPTNKIIVNPNGVNETVFDAFELAHDKYKTRASLGIPEDAFILGYVGGMETFRRLPEVVDRVAAIYRQGYKNLFLLIVGDGDDMPRVVATVEENADGFKSHVKLLGWVDYQRVPKIMTCFDVAIFPFTEPYCSPLKLFEYMALGLATVGPKISAVKELFSDSEHIKLISQDGENFEVVITELIESEEMRNQMGQRGKEHVLGNYTWGRNAQRVVDAIRDV